MELHSPLMAKKLWNSLRIAFFMARRGLISKRKLAMDVNLMFKRGKLAGKTLANLMFHHRSTAVGGAPFGIRQYEFSCSNSPDPVFFHMSSKRRHSYFPCIHATPTIDELDEAPGLVTVLPRIEFSPRLTTPHSPFSVRISDYSKEEEEEEGEVDAEAEEFIKRFYEQLRAQSPVGLMLQD